MEENFDEKMDEGEDKLLPEQDKKNLALKEMVLQQKSQMLKLVHRLKVKKKRINF